LRDGDAGFDYDHDHDNEFEKNYVVVSEALTNSRLENGRQKG